MNKQIFTEQRVKKVTELLSNTIGKDLSVTLSNRSNQPSSIVANHDKIDININLLEEWQDGRKELEVQRTLTFAVSDDFPGITYAQESEIPLAYLLLYLKGETKITGIFRGRDKTLAEHNTTLADNLNGIEKSVASFILNKDNTLLTDEQKSIVNNYLNQSVSLEDTVKLLLSFEGQEQPDSGQEQPDSGQEQPDSSNALEKIAGLLSPSNNESQLSNNKVLTDAQEQQYKQNISTRVIVVNEPEFLSNKVDSNTGNIYPSLPIMLKLADKSKIDSKVVKYYLSTHKTQYQFGRRTGILNRKSIPRIHLGKRDICKKRNNIQMKKRGAALLIDLSGSMRQGIQKTPYIRAEAVFASCLSLSKFYRNTGIDFSIIGFTCNDYPIMNGYSISKLKDDKREKYCNSSSTLLIIKELKEPFTVRKLAHKLSKVNVYGSTPTGDALCYADQLLEGYDIKSVLCITDGETNRISKQAISYIKRKYGSAGRYNPHIDYAKLLINNMRKNNTSVGAILFGESTGKNLTQKVFGNGHFYYCDKIDQLNEAIIKLVTKEDIDK